VLEGADVPRGRVSCPGAECCGWIADSPDPCRGCSLKRDGSDESAPYYALFLYDYIETFSPRPQKVSWRDYEIYRACREAREEYLLEMGRKATARPGTI